MLVLVNELLAHPYAKMHTLYPSTADCTRCLVSSNTVGGTGHVM